MIEQDVIAALVLTKKMNLRSVNGSPFTCMLNVYECEHPYCIIYQISLEHDHEQRMDVFREDIAREIGEWIKGKLIRNAALISPKRVDDAMSAFVKIGKTPPQVDLLMWILSRTEITWGNHPSMRFGGSSVSTVELDLQLEESDYTLHNEFPRTSQAAASAQNKDPFQLHRIGSTESLLRSSVHKPRPSSAPSNGRRAAQRSSYSYAADDDMGTLSATKKLLGTSNALDSLQTKKVQGRNSARQSYTTATWTPDQIRMVPDLKKAREDIEHKMEERRRVIEAGKAREQLAKEKYEKVRSTISQQSRGWKDTATHELQNYIRIQAEVETDIRRQKTQAMHNWHRTVSTIAPPGYVNRRGATLPGAYIGPGPLPSAATTALRNVQLEKTCEKYYWDSLGRRHERRENVEERGSAVEQAMEAIRKAASNIVCYKLNLREVFNRFDASGDGFISVDEMGDVFLSMGVDLSDEALDAVFRHFDPDGSNTIDYQEFVWAFFNKRSLMRQWCRNTEGMTHKQIISTFHRVDLNGDGLLSPREFRKLLNSFSIEMSELEFERLMVKFDSNGDGNIDLHEFMDFMHAEEKIFLSSTQAESGHNGQSGKTARKDTKTQPDQKTNQWKPAPRPLSAGPTMARSSSGTTGSSSRGNVSVNTQKGAKGSMLDSGISTTLSISTSVSEKSRRSRAAPTPQLSQKERDALRSAGAGPPRAQSADRNDSRKSLRSSTSSLGVPIDASRLEHSKGGGGADGSVAAAAASTAGEPLMRQSSSKAKFLTFNEPLVDRLRSGDDVDVDEDELKVGDEKGWEGREEGGRGLSRQSSVRSLSQSQPVTMKEKIATPRDIMKSAHCHDGVPSGSYIDGSEGEELEFDVQQSGDGPIVDAPIIRPALRRTSSGQAEALIASNEPGAGMQTSTSIISGLPSQSIPSTSRRPSTSSVGQEVALDSSWMAKVIAKQEKIERQLGGKYFRR